MLLILPNLGRGGAQQVFRDQLLFYSSHFNVVGVIFNWDDSFEDDRLPNVISLDISAGNNWLEKIVSFLKRIIALRKIKKQYNIDISISHLEGADYVNVFSKRTEKTVCWIHGSKTFDRNIEGLLGFIRKKILIPITYRLSDLIITVSDGARYELTRDFRIPYRRITTIHNGINLKEISRKAERAISPYMDQLLSSKPILITHCRLSRQKNLFSLIDIFISTKTQCNVKLVILGDGELRTELIEYCRTNKLRTYSTWEQPQTPDQDYDIYFPGYERNPYPFLHRASLYLMTSSWEGFPLSLCEAMACGVPVISSDCYTGPREIISPGLDAAQPIRRPTYAQYGVLMPLASNGTTKDWANTITDILRNSNIRSQLIAKGKERAVSFDHEKMRSKWLTVIEQLTN